MRPRRPPPQPPDRARIRVHRDTIQRPTVRRFFRVNPFLAVGQIIVSIALIAAILLQARGTGLSGTFGGDSAVYRSRRGVERRVWQLSPLLPVFFCLFFLSSFLFVPAAGSARAPPGPP